MTCPTTHRSPRPAPAPGRADLMTDRRPLIHAYRATSAASRRWHTAYTTLRTLRPAAIDAFNTRNAHTLGGARLHDQPGPGPVIEHDTQPPGCRPYPWSQAGAAAPMWVPDRRTRLGRVYADQIADLTESPGAVRITRLPGQNGAQPGLTP